MKYSGLIFLNSTRLRSSPRLPIRNNSSVRILKDFSGAFSAIEKNLADFNEYGKVADYIPELANVDPSKFGMHLVTTGGSHHCIGDNLEKFSIQSISKVFTLALAVSQVNSVTFDRVGVEPSGCAFNSLVQLEQDKGIPRNPFINAGAIVMCDIMLDTYDDPKEEMLRFVRLISGNESIDFNTKVAHSERETGFRNFALANFMKSFGNLHHSVDEVLDLYFSACSIEMSCRDLALAFGVFANEGVLIESALSDTGPNGTRVLPRSHVRRINAVMQTCGFYDEAGEFAFLIGLPGKSGVGGGIVAVHPRMYSVATWSPRLNAKGNSAKGMKALDLLVDQLDETIF